VQPLYAAVRDHASCRMDQIQTNPLPPEIWMDGGIKQESMHATIPGHDPDISLHDASLVASRLLLLLRQLSGQDTCRHVFASGCVLPGPQGREIAATQAFGFSAQGRESR
jgi:hypothetical protein